MTDGDYRLHLSTRAIAQTEEAIHLIEQKERLEAALISSDAPLALDLSKALLETIFKTIINDRADNEDLNIEFKPMYRRARELVRFSDEEYANQILERVASGLVHSVGELRNRYGAASHGDDGYHENPIEMCNVEFIASAVDGLVGSLYFRHRETLHPGLAQRIQYSDYGEFNDWVDEQFGGYEMPLGNGNVILFSASELLYKHDVDSYKEMLLQFLSTEAEDQDE